MYIKVTANTEELCELSQGFRAVTGLQFRLYLTKRSRLLDGSAVALLRVDRQQDKIKLMKHLTTSKES